MAPRAGIRDLLVHRCESSCLAADIEALVITGILPCIYGSSIFKISIVGIFSILYEKVRRWGSRIDELVRRWKIFLEAALAHRGSECSERQRGRVKIVEDDGNTYGRLVNYINLPQDRTYLGLSIP